MGGCPLYVKHIAIGDPAKEILKLAEKENVDWIVMATRGRKGHFRFGSVTDVPVVAISITTAK